EPGFDGSLGEARIEIEVFVEKQVPHECHGELWKRLENASERRFVEHESSTLNNEPRSSRDRNRSTAANRGTQECQVVGNACGLATAPVTWRRHAFPIRAPQPVTAELSADVHTARSDCAPRRRRCGPGSSSRGDNSTADGSSAVRFSG